MAPERRRCNTMRSETPASPPAPARHTHTHACATKNCTDTCTDTCAASPPASACCGSACAPAPIAPTAPVEPAAPGADTLLLRVPDMDCPSEEAMIRRALEGMTALRALRFDLGARTVRVDAPASAWPAIEQAIAATGLATQRLGAAAGAPADTARRQRREWLRLGAALALALTAEALHALAPPGLPWQVAGMALAALAIALSGLGVYRKGLTALWRRQLGISALMTVAVTGAFLIARWPEAAMVMALYALAELIEARAVDRARGAIQKLLALAPSVADVRQPDGHWRAQPAQGVAVGAVVRVRPGERLPLDGRVLAGHSAVDQASVTGESVPVEKGSGDPVFAGTVNQHGALEFETTAPASDTVLARIIHAVEQAQGLRAPTQRWVDRFAAVYTPAVFALALAVTLGGPWLAGWAWPVALYKALVLLVIACPCALVISTPVTVVSALAAAARRGILIKGGVYLEDARRLTHIALDKTGTLTEGRPRLLAFEPWAPGDAQALWPLAHALAARSDHPVSQAIAAGLAAHAAPEPLPVLDFAAEPGRGTHGRIGARRLVLANARWIAERGQLTPALQARLDAHAAQGRSLSLLADDGGVLALLAVADALRPEAAPALHELRALGIATVMLTGDNPATAQAIAAQAGIADVRAGLLPQDKLHAIESLAAGAGRRIGMVGDGINDAPALAAAHIGFALGAGGTHIASEAADIVIMRNDLRAIAATVRLSRHAHAVLWQNIALALGIKAVFLALAVAGHATMWMAVFADMGASLLVVANGLRLLRWRAPDGGAPRP